MSPAARKTAIKRSEPLARERRLVPDLAAKLVTLERIFSDTRDAEGRQVFKARCGVYAFFDFDGEPIYVGQSYERLQTRIRRHLTNQRTDAVAMHVLDPVEVAEIRIWPLRGEIFEKGTNSLTDKQKADRKSVLDRIEYTVYEQLLKESPIGAILNEVVPMKQLFLKPPPSFGGRIVPTEATVRLYHRDERIARRAETVANLARVIKERDVQLGLRATLVVQAERLRRLATQRYNEVRGEMTPEQIQKETEGSGPEKDQEVGGGE